MGIGDLSMKKGKFFVNRDKAGSYRFGKVIRALRSVAITEV